MLQEGEIVVINTEEKEGVIVSGNFEKIKWLSIILCMIGILMGRVCVFKEYYTLSVCFVGVLYFDQELRKWTPIMTILGILSMGLFSTVCVKYIMMIGLLVLLRSYMILTKRKINITNQAALVGIAIMVINLISNIVNEFNIYRFLTGTLEAMVGISLFVVLSYSIDLIYNKKKTPLVEKEIISLALLLAGILAGMIDFYVKVPMFKQIYMRDVLVFIIIIAVTYLDGIHSSVVITMLMSTLLTVIGYMPAHFASIFTFAAIVGASFRFLGKFGTGLALGLGLILGFTLFNDKIIDFEIIGAYAVGLGVNLILPRNYFGLAEWFGYKNEIDEEKHLDRIESIVTDRLRHYAEAFSYLGRTFNKISEKDTYISHKDIDNIIEDTGKKVCQNCSLKQFCWEDYPRQTYEVSYKILESLEKKGQVVLRDIPNSFKERCLNAESFACTLSFKLDLFKQNKLWRNKINEMRQTMSQQIEGVAETLSSLTEHFKNEFYFDKDGENRIRELLLGKGIKTKDVIVLEIGGVVREIHLYIHYKVDKNLKENINAAVREGLMLQAEVEKYEYNEKEDYCYFKLIPTKKYSVVAQGIMCAKEEVSGDVYSFAEAAQGTYILALADGMGSGQKAKEESMATIELLENFLESGFKSNLTVKLINSALVLKSDVENFSTLDVIIINEYTGIAEFLKMGASVSFLIRNGEVTTIETSSLPIGILSHVEVESCKKQLKEGDVIVMVTDGVLDAHDNILGKEETFKHFILEANTANPEYLVKHLMQKSRNLLGGEEIDDMTILAACIHKEY